MNDVVRDLRNLPALTLDCSIDIQQAIDSTALKAADEIERAQADREDIAQFRNALRLARISLDQAAPVGVRDLIDKLLQRTCSRCGGQLATMPRASVHGGYTMLCPHCDIEKPLSVGTKP